MDDTLASKCNYLFYEQKADEDNEGGYKIELSFEEKQTNFCDISKITEVLFMEEGSKQVGGSSQSILSTFYIHNSTLLEMRRMMASKCTVNFQGTTFNIFKLVKMINMMKSKNASAAGGD